MAEPSARDRKSALRVLQVAQVAYDLSRFPKKQVLGDRGDTKRLLDSVASTRAATADLSPELRDGAAVKWPELIADPGDAEAAWRIAKRVIPTLFAELRPLLGAEEEEGGTDRGTAIGHRRHDRWDEPRPRGLRRAELGHRAAGPCRVR